MKKDMLSGIRSTKTVLLAALFFSALFFSFGPSAHAEVLVDLDTTGSYIGDGAGHPIFLKGKVWESTGATIESVSIKIKSTALASSPAAVYGTVLTSGSPPTTAKSFQSNPISIDSNATKYVTIAVKLIGGISTEYLVGSTVKHQVVSEPGSSVRKLVFVITGNGDSDSTTWKDPGNTGTPSTSPSIQTVAQSGFGVMFKDETRTDTKFTANITFDVTPATLGKPVEFAVMYGETAATLSTPLTIFQKDGSPVNGPIIMTSGNSNYMVSLAGLAPAKKYYFALTAKADHDKWYAPLQAVLAYAGGTGIATGTGAATGTTTGTGITGTTGTGTAGTATTTGTGTGTTGTTGTTTTGTTGSVVAPGGLVGCDGTPANPCRFGDIMKMINTVLNFFIKWIIMPIAAIIIAYVGFLFLTSAGSPETVTKAKGVLLKAVIGLVVILAAWLIINTVLISFLRKDIGSEYNLLAQ